MQFMSGLFGSKVGLLVPVCLCVFPLLTACRAGSEPSEDDFASGGSGGQAGSAEGGGAGETAGGAGGVDDAGAPLGGTGGDTPVAGAGGTALAVCDGNGVICEGFEGHGVGAFEPAVGWSVSSKGATMDVDETRAHSGQRSLKITVAPSGGAVVGSKQALIGTTDKAVLSTGKSAYARMMFYLENIPSGKDLHWSFMRASGFLMQDGKAGTMIHNLGGQPSRLRNLMLWPTNEGLQDCFNDSFTQIPVQQWTCLEWHLDPESQVVEVWLDGVKQAQNSWTTKPIGGGCVLDQTGGKWVIPKLLNVQFGWIDYRANNGMTMWIDDLALDNKRIGCGD